MRGGAVSADTHTSAPIGGVTVPDNGGSGYAILSDEYASGAHDISSPTSPAAGSLTWNRDSSSGLAAFARPQPRMRQLMGVCGWAAVLGGLGLVVGVRGLIGDLMGLAPSWYEPSMIVVGLLGILLTVGAFATVHRRRMPYVLLGASSISLIYAMVLTATAF